MMKFIYLSMFISICACVESRPNSSGSLSSNAAATSIFKISNIPQFDQLCGTIVYTCKRKLPFGADLLTGTATDTSRPCLKYCVKHVICDSGHKIRGKPNECVELNEELVREEFERQKSEIPSEKHVTIMPVAMIDFPCQPGFLPDGRGKCREAF